MNTKSTALLSKRAIALTLAAVSLAAPLLSSCSSNSGGSVNPGKSSTSNHVAAPQAELTTNLKSNNVFTDLNEKPITFSVKNGTLTNVAISGEDSKNAVLVKDSNSSWYYNGRLDGTHSYQATVSYKNADNVNSSKSFAFKTFSPTAVNSIILNPGNNTIGVGMPVVVQFKRPVPLKSHAYVQKHLKVTTNNNTPGSWGWIDNQTIVWRPDSFWKPGTKGKAEVNLRGLDLGNGVIGSTNVFSNFTVGRKLEMNVSNKTKTMTVSINDKVVRTIPVSLGRPGMPTSSGTSIIFAKQSPVRMKAYDYDETVYYAQQFTVTGEYVHSAPWSVADQGVRNVSHGCVNISSENAKWLWGQTQVGDVIKISGTGDNVSPWNGMGGSWNYILADWKKQSANTFAYDWQKNGK